MTRSPLRADCPVCGSEQLIDTVRIARLPVFANVLYDDPGSAKAVQTGVFNARACPNCGHVFNADFDNDLVGYTQSYENALTFSPRFRAFADELVERLATTYDLAGKTLVDIGCGKGDFIKQLATRTGARGFGFDQAYEPDRDSQTPEGISFSTEWFGPKHGDLKPDFISCRHVLEHIYEPRAFLADLARNPGVSPDTVFYFEVPNVMYTLRDMGIWDLIYEHVSYFSERSLDYVFRATGFEPIEIGESFGGQYLFIEARVTGQPAENVSPSDAVSDFGPCVHAFRERYASKLTEWRGQLETGADAVAVWGAGSKGISFVNVMEMAADGVRLVDINPHKRGKFAPMTGQPVVAPDDLQDAPPSTVFVMNALYHDEIAVQLAGMGIIPTLIDA